MSIVSQLIGAFKKGVESRSKDPNWPPPNTGPRDVPGTDTPQDDGRERRLPPSEVGGKPVVEVAEGGGGDAAPIADLRVGGGGPKVPVDRPTVGGTKTPDAPSDSGSQTPTGGTGGGSTTPPSAPFDPNGGVIFRTAPGGGPEVENGLPVIGEGSGPDAEPPVAEVNRILLVDLGERELKPRTNLRANEEGSGSSESEGPATPVDRGSEAPRQTPNTGFGDKVAQGTVNVASSDPEEGGEIAKRADFDKQNAPIDRGMDEAGEKADVQLKQNVDPAFTRRLRIDGSDAPQVASSDPEEGGEVSGLRGPLPNPQAEDRGFADSLARKAGEGQKDFPDIKLQDSPDLDDDDGLADALARKAGGSQQEYFKVKMEEVFVTSARADAEPQDDGELPHDETGAEAFLRINKGPGPKAFADLDRPLSADNDDLSDDDKSGVAGWIARGKGTKKGFNRQEMDDTLDSREASADEMPDDDDFESSSLLDLKPAAATSEMLPGLAGELPDDADFDFEVDDVDADSDESEL